MHVYTIYIWIVVYLPVCLMDVTYRSIAMKMQCLSKAIQPEEALELIACGQFGGKKFYHV